MRFRGATLGLLVLVLVACQEVPPLRIAVPLNFSAIIPCLSQKKTGLGFHSSDVEVEWVPNTAAALENFSNNKVDLSVVALSSLVPTLKKDQDVRIITEILNSNRSMVLVVRTSSKITAPRHLKGKKIGLAPGASFEIFLEYFLLTEGVNLGSVRTSLLELEELKKQFLAGRLDAMVIWEPELSRIKRDNPALFIHEFQSFVHESKSVLVGRQDLLKKEQKRIDRLLRTWMEAEVWYAAHPRDAEEHLMGCLGLDTASIESMRPALLSARAELKLSNSLRQSYDRNREWQILRKGLKDADLAKFADVLDTSFLRRTRKRSITLGSGAER